MGVDVRLSGLSRPLLAGLRGAAVEFTGSTVLSFFGGKTAVKAGAAGFKGFGVVSAKAISMSSGLTVRAFLEGCWEDLATLGPLPELEASDSSEERSAGVFSASLEDWRVGVLGFGNLHAFLPMVGYRRA